MEEWTLPKVSEQGNGKARFKIISSFSIQITSFKKLLHAY